MDKLRIVIPGTPVAQGRPRLTTMGGFARAYDPKKSRDWKAIVKEFAIKAMIDQGFEEPFTGPLRMWVKCIMPLPKSSWRKRTPIQEEWNTKKPDADNLYKGIADALEGIVYHNDSHISEVHILKRTAEQGKGPKTMIEISIIDD
jgi:Holliday junction resolvase RusA-like endonuclease